MDARDGEEMKGSITASCGHVLKDDEGAGLDVMYGDETCDAEQGFLPCIVYACFCRKCEHEWRARGDLFDGHEQAEAWLDSQTVNRTPKER